MSNDFGEIQREDRVTNRIKMLNCWDVSVIDHSSWRVVLVGLRVMWLYGRIFCFMDDYYKLYRPEWPTNRST